MSIKNKKKLLDLIVSICTRVKEREGYLNKTKLIKYLYLIDIEYYKENKELLTGFNWIFHNFGPWANEYEEIFKEMEKSPIFTIKEGGRPDLDTKFISCSEKLNVEDLNTNVDCKIKRIIDKWADETIGPMLNYVYFKTEPMVNAERYKELDFNNINTLEPRKEFKLTSGTLTKKELIKLKEKINANLKKIGITFPSKPRYMEPKYDDVYQQGMEILNSDDSY